MASIRNSQDEAVCNFHFAYLGAISGGANWSTTPPVNTKSRLCSISFRFTTSAIAGDRKITLNLNNGSNVTPIAFPVVTQIASVVNYFLYTTGVTNYISPDTTHHVIPISSDIVLLEGWSIDSSIENLQAGDLTALFAVIFKLWTFEQ